ncbi:MAG: hypothetical protein WD533_06410 [Dehalococcoidia bacterium]
MRIAVEIDEDDFRVLERFARLGGKSIHAFVADGIRGMVMGLTYAATRPDMLGEVLDLDIAKFLADHVEPPEDHGG